MRYEEASVTGHRKAAVGNGDRKRLSRRRMFERGGAALDKRARQGVVGEDYSIPRQCSGHVGMSSAAME